MSRELFLKHLEEADDFFIPDPTHEDFIKKEVNEKGFITYKNYFANRGSDIGTSWLSGINIELIKRLTINIQPEINPFIAFYQCDKKQIKNLVSIMAHTHKALRYYELYSDHYREAKKPSDKGKAAKALKKAIKVIKEIDKDACLSDKDLKTRKEAGYSHDPIGAQVVKHIQYLINGLSNNHYTKRQLFQDLLFNLNDLLHSIEPTIARAKVFEITNTLIEQYYNENIRFTTKTNLDNFKSNKYIYETVAGITITHGKK